MARPPTDPPDHRPLATRPIGALASGSSRPRRTLAAADRFWADERRAGLLLVVAAVAAVAWASSPWAGSYASTWGHPARVPWFPAIPDVRAWIDDAAMTVFFVVVGLEIGRERVVGSLISWRRAAVPAVAALGGMAGAALVYAAVVHGGAGANGWGVPMATDIALVAGVAAVLGDRVPARLRLFLVTLAVADDVASVVVLAAVSGHSVSPAPLAAAAAVVATLAAGRRRWRTAWPAAVALVPLWMALARAGVEPALAGAVAGALVPVRALASVPDSPPTPASPPVTARPPVTASPPTSAGPPVTARPPVPARPARRRLTGPRLERALHPVSAVVVLPLFALANVGVDLRAPLFGVPGAAGVFAGVVAARVLGKTVGVAGAGRLAAGWFRAPHAASSSGGRLFGGAALCGAGFTVPLLFAAVAFEGQPALLQAASAGLLAGSVAAVVLGVVVLVGVVRQAPGASDVP